VVAVALMLVALFPQIHFMVNRGRAWRGANAISHPDEVAYSAYLASLVRGNPRRYDPFTGRGAQAEAAESLFSLQVVPAYAVALPARWLGASASIAFIILSPLCALASSLAVFWFISLLTRDERFSGAAALVILGWGTLMAGQGIVRHVPNLNYLIPLWISNKVSPPSLYHLPFLRLYQPGVAFPLFFVFCAFVWLALTRPKQRQAIGLASGAGLVFALLMFSYFYLWTAAAAWLGCLCALWLLFNRAERSRAFVVFGIIFGSAAVALVPYLRMLSQRAATVDAAQALVFTHQPDFLRLPEIFALLVLAVLGFGVRRGTFRGNDPVGLVAVSFALTVLVVFNQQIVTGRSLQPIHYQWFIANYCALTAAVLTAARSWQGMTNGRLALVAAGALLFAFAEVWLAASVSWNYNLAIDAGKPAADRLAREFQAGTSAAVPVVLVADLKLADRLPTDAPQAVLWAPRMLVFPGVSEVENRERFFQQLHYLGYDEKKFWAKLDTPDWDFLTGLFSYRRLSPAVSGDNQPIMPAELGAQFANFVAYSRTFNRERASSPTLSYLIVDASGQTDLANLDRWYQRDAGERLGEFILYRLKLRE